MGVFLAAAVLALAILPSLSVEAAEGLVRRGTYPVLLVSLFLWAVSLYRLGKGLPKPQVPRDEWIETAVLVAFFTLMAVSAEPFRSKIIYDEFVLQATALNLHLHRIAATVSHGYTVLGEVVPFISYLDKRPNFYPFLVSLAHDLFGYREANAFLVNAGLYSFTLGLGGFLGRRLHGRWGCRIAVILLGTLPLLGQNATGAGMDLLNVCMILAVTALGGVYLRRTDGPSLSALVLGTVLLAHTRYESAAYALPTAILVVVGWRKRGAMVMDWHAAAAPLLLVPVALQIKVMNHQPLSWELSGQVEARFGVGYLWNNLAGAAAFLFSTSAGQANSIVLSVLGLASLAWLALKLARRGSSPLGLQEDRLALAVVGLGVLGNTALLMFYFWSRFDDSMAARLSLPLHLLLALAVVVAAADLWHRFRLLPRVVLGGAVAATLSTAGHYANPEYSATGIQSVEWEQDFVAMQPSRNRLMLFNRSPLPWILRGHSALFIPRVPKVLGNLRQCVQDGVFEEVLVVQSCEPTPPAGKALTGLSPIPQDRLPDGFDLEPLAERRFGDRITQISRLLAIRDHAQEPVPGAVVAQ